MIGSKPKKYTKLELSSIVIPPTADFDLSENVSLIGDATDIKRTVNGNALNISRAVYRKYSVDISASDMRSAGVHGIATGDYIECIPSEPFMLSIPGLATLVTLPRASVDVVGVKEDGGTILPNAQPQNRLPMHVIRTSERIAQLRTKPTISFSAPVQLVRFRPLLACIVTNWSSSSDERAATASWNLSMEEI